MAAQLAERFTIPPHVPPELVHPVGLTYGPEFLASPHDYMASFHEQFPPIFYCPSEMTGNAWFLLKHADCFFALRHPEIFTTAGATPFPRDPDNRLILHCSSNQQSIRPGEKGADGIGLIRSFGTGDDDRRRT